MLAGLYVGVSCSKSGLHTSGDTSLLGTRTEGAMLPVAGYVLSAQHRNMLPWNSLEQVCFSESSNLQAAVPAQPS